MYICTFIGHRDCPESIRPTLYKTISSLIVNNDVKTFYVGTHGNFDRMVYDVLCELQLIYSIKVCVILAYRDKTGKQTYYQTDQTIYPDILEKTPLRFAINKRNIYMINQSQYMICYMDYTNSNTLTFVKTAIKKGLRVINLGSSNLCDIT